MQYLTGQVFKKYEQNRFQEWEETELRSQN